MKTITKVETRWRLDRDVPAMMEIENLCHSEPWDEVEMWRTLRHRSRICRVAEVNRKIVGYVIYELSKEYLNVTNLAVHPDWQRQGVGTELIGRLKRCLSEQRRSRIYAAVSEQNLDAHLFFQAQEFRAVDILRGFYDQVDAYDFVYELT